MITELWNATRDMHHACEQHVVGAAMASGKPHIEWYAGWIRALEQIHAHIDPHMPLSVHRVSRLQADLTELEMNPAQNTAAAAYIEQLTDEKSIAGACYVLTGAHLMGGEVMRRRLDGYPTNHLVWDDRKEALSVLSTYRTRTDINEQARNCFTALLKVMDEIKEVYPQ